MANALTDFANVLWPNGLGLIGPTVDDDIRRAIQRYGQAAVIDAVKQQSKAKRGRRKIPDWVELQPYIEEDSRIWLEGGDPFSARTDYAIAKAQADANPGHNHAATMQRLERKLRSKRFSRKWFVFVTAMEMSRETFPYKRHIAAIVALRDLEPQGHWGLSLELAEGRIADFERVNGPPADELTMVEIEKGSSPMSLGAFVSPPRRGIFGGSR